MSDDFGNLASMSAGDMATAYSAYKVGRGLAPFARGALDATNSATTVLPLARAAGGAIVKRAAAGAGVELAEGALARGAIGATATGLAEAGVLGAGAASGIGAMAGPLGLAAAVALPIAMQHAPMGVRKAVNSIPLLGSTLSPIHKKPKAANVTEEPGTSPTSPTFTQGPAPSPTVSGAQFAAANRSNFNRSR